METIFPPVRRENLESSRQAGRRVGGRSGVGRERDRNKEEKLTIPHIHRDDLAVVIAGGFEEAISKLLRN